MKIRYRKCIYFFLLLFFLVSCSPSAADTGISGTEPGSQNESSTNTANIIPAPLATGTPTPDPYRIESENIDNIALLAKLGNERIIGMDWSPDGKMIVAYGENYLELFDANDFHVMQSIRLANAYEKVNCKHCSSQNFGKLLFNPDGSQIAITIYGNYNHQIALWNMQSWGIEKIINAGNNYFSSIEYSADGSLIAACNGFSSDEIFIWNTNTGEMTNKLTDTDLGCFDIVFNKDNSKLVSYGLTNTLRIWNLQTNELEHEIAVSKGKAIDVSPQNDTFAIETNLNHLQIYDFDGNLIKETLLNQDLYSDEIYTLQYNPSGTLLVSGSRWGNIQFFDVNSGNLIKDMDVDGYDIYETRFSSDDTKLAILTHDGLIRVWTLREYADMHATATPASNIQIQSNFEILPYDQYILYSDTISGMRIRSIDGTLDQPLSDRIYGIPISADGRILQLHQNTYHSADGNTLNLLDGIKTTTKFTGLVSPNGEWVANLKYFENEKGIVFHNTIDNSEQFLPLDLPNSLGLQVSDHIDDLFWSTTGKQIFYIRYTEQVGMNGQPPPWEVFPTNGLYILDSACLQKLETCLDTQKFIFSPYKIHYYYPWSLSPDNRYAIVNAGNQFILFDTMKGTVEKIPINIDGITSNFTPEAYISPDNQWITFSTGDENAYIQPLSGGPATKIIDAPEYGVLLGWLTSPYLQIGDSFKVLPAGDHVNIRENPDLDASELTFLISGNTFTVLDGPIQEDGYTWWFVESAVDGTEGWLSEFYRWYEKIEVAE